LSINAITPEPLEISSRTFQGIIMWSKGRPSSKTTIVGCAGGENTSPMFYFFTFVKFDFSDSLLPGDECRNKFSCVH